MLGFEQLPTPSSKTSPQCRNALLLSPDISLVRCRDDVSEIYLTFRD